MEKLDFKLKEMSEALGQRIEHFNFCDDVLKIDSNLHFTNVASERAISVCKHVFGKDCTFVNFTILRKNRECLNFEGFRKELIDP